MKKQQRGKGQGKAGRRMRVLLRVVTRQRGKVVELWIEQVSRRQSGQGLWGNVEGRNAGVVTADGPSP